VRPQDLGRAPKDGLSGLAILIFLIFNLFYFP
jgi:hypothetical protein